MWALPGPSLVPPASHSLYVPPSFLWAPSFLFSNGKQPGTLATKCLVLTWLPRPAPPLASTFCAGLPLSALTWPPSGTAAAIVCMSVVEDVEHLPCFSFTPIFSCARHSLSSRSTQAQTMALSPYFST